MTVTTLPSSTTDDASGLFDLDVTTVEVTDPGGLVNLTDDNCGSTCPNACVTGSA